METSFVGTARCSLSVSETVFTCSCVSQQFHCVVFNAHRTQNMKTIRAVWSLASVSVFFLRSSIDYFLNFSAISCITLSSYVSVSCHFSYDSHGHVTHSGYQTPSIFHGTSDEQIRSRVCTKTFWLLHDDALRSGVQHQAVSISVL